LQQIVLADRKLFLKLAEFTGAGIQLTGLGSPVDSVFEKAMNHPDVLHLLQPMPALKSQSSQSVFNTKPSSSTNPSPWTIHQAIEGQRKDRENAGVIDHQNAPRVGRWSSGHKRWKCNLF